MHVADVMTKDVVTLRPYVPFKDAVACMLDADVSGVPVVDEHRAVVGIVTEADLMPKEAYNPGHKRATGLGHLAGRAKGRTRKARALTTGDLMTTTVHNVSSTDDIRTAAREMIEHGVKRLPVVDDGRLVGIVSRRDVLRVFTRSDDDLQEEIEARLRNPLRWPPVSRLACAVWDGRVLIEGEVEEPDDRAVIGAFVSRIPGVVKVHNNLRVRPRGALVLEEHDRLVS
jgi:CBS domain-containing protein